MKSLLCYFCERTVRSKDSQVKEFNIKHSKSVDIKSNNYTFNFQNKKKKKETYVYACLRRKTILNIVYC